MYIAEFAIWLGSSIKSSTRKKLKMGDLDGEMSLKEVSQDYTEKSVSDNPRPIGPYYVYNKRYLEIRGGMFENFRGIIAWISLMLFFFTAGFGYIWIGSILRLYNHETTEIAETIFAIVVFGIIFLGLFYLLIRYFRYVIRLELFTIRHIRVRFNRITRQVYIQRPKYCGGTVICKWQDIMPANFGETGSDMSDTNMVNLFVFHPYKTGFPVAHLVGIGKNSYNGQDFKDEWEFIRRYMEEGPELLPKPRLSTHLPMPWHGLEGHIKPVFHLLKQSHNIIIILMMIPVLLILIPFFTVGYFISECLCWQPRWPKIIRQAGLPGKPTPPETKLSDYPPAVQKAILDSPMKWTVRDEKTGELVDYAIKID